MKKTLLSVLAVVSVMGAASAVPSAADRKAMCESKPDKYVWVEKNQACVPVNPCTSSNDDMKAAYCDRTFKDIQMWDGARTIATVYLSRVRKVRGDFDYEHSTTGVKYYGQDYLAYKTSDGGYIVLEFDDTSDFVDSSEDYIKAACLAYGQTPTKDGCVLETADRVLCSSIAELASRVYDRGNITGEIVDRDEPNVCEMKVETTQSVGQKLKEIFL